jgi:hypothetical protein
VPTEYIPQCVSVERLDEVVVDPRDPGPPFRVLDPGHDDQERPAVQNGAQPLGHGVPVRVRQTDIQDHHVRGTLDGEADGIGSVAGDAGQWPNSPTNSASESTVSG